VWLIGSPRDDLASITTGCLSLLNITDNSMYHDPYEANNVKIILYAGLPVVSKENPISLKNRTETPVGHPH
jgi:hypothetical protein